MISFIIPAYNEELELSSTIASIRVAASGVTQPYEIIVVDDASTDATAELAAQAGAISMRLADSMSNILSAKKSVSVLQCESWAASKCYANQS